MDVRVKSYAEVYKWITGEEPPDDKKIPKDIPLNGLITFFDQNSKQDLCAVKSRRIKLSYFEHELVKAFIKTFRK